LARVGGRYSDEWHVEHLIDPRAVVPTSIMPGYPRLAETEVRTEGFSGNLRANATIGVPYSQAMIENAVADLRMQADPNADSTGLIGRYGNKVTVRDFDGDPTRVTEMDALVAYLQMLGTLVDFTAYEPRAEENLR
jgi:cytochrome c oxidase cbb3-type subunit 2